VRSLVLRRLTQFIPVLILVSLVAAGLTELIPGSPGQRVLGEFATAERIADFDAKIGADLPFFERYASWLGNALRGDLGVSPISRIGVSQAILNTMPVTLELAGLTMLISLMIAVPLAVLSAGNEQSAADRIITGGSAAILAMPSFVVAVSVTHVIAVQLGWVPSFGWNRWSAGVGAHLKTLALPLLVLVSVVAPIFTRVLRADLVATLRQDFVLSARARGFSDARILFLHVLRPSLTSLLTLTGLVFGYLVGGSIVVETFFGVPGLGQLVARSINSKDILVVQGIVLYVAFAYLLLNLLVDILQALVDPRLREAR